MKITAIRLTPVRIRRHTGFENRHVIVEIDCDEGLTGIGEMSDFSHLPRYMPDVGDLEETLGRLLRGRDPRDIEAIAAELAAQFPSANDYYDKSHFIRCGVDIALHDLLAKKLGEPVSTLLGGRARRRLKVCYPIFRHRRSDEVAANLAIVRRRLEEGFDTFRLYVGANLDADVAFLQAVFAEFGDRVTIKSLDFSHLLDWKAARTAMRRFEAFHFLMVESPAWRDDARGLAEFRRSVDHPVSEHVWSFAQMRRLVEHDAVDIFNIAPIFIGGLTAARKAFALAEACEKRCLIGTTQELSIGVAAAAQLGAAMPALTDISDPTGPALYVDDVVREPVRYEDGYLLVPPAERPGLGVELDPERLRALMAPLSWGDSSLAGVLDRTAPGPG